MKRALGLWWRPGRTLRGGPLVCGWLDRSAQTRLLDSSNTPREWPETAESAPTDFWNPTGQNSLSAPPGRAPAPLLPGGCLLSRASQNEARLGTLVASREDPSYAAGSFARLKRASSTPRTLLANGLEPANPPRPISGTLRAPADFWNPTRLIYSARTCLQTRALAAARVRSLFFSVASDTSRRNMGKPSKVAGRKSGGVRGTSAWGHQPLLAGTDLDTLLPDTG